MEDDATFPGDGEVVVFALGRKEAFDVMNEGIFEGGIEDDLVPIGALHAGKEISGASPYFLVIDKDFVVRDTEIVGSGSDELIDYLVSAILADMAGRGGGGFVKNVLAAYLIEAFHVAGRVDDEVVILPLIVILTEPDGVDEVTGIGRKAAGWGVEVAERNMRIAFDVEGRLGFAGLGKFQKASV